MQSLKTIFLLALMLGVGYGVHVVLNKPPASDEDAIWNESAEVDLPKIDFGTGTAGGSPLGGGGTVPTAAGEVPLNTETTGSNALVNSSPAPPLSPPQSETAALGNDTFAASGPPASDGDWRQLEPASNIPVAPQASTVTGPPIEAPGAPPFPAAPVPWPPAPSAGPTSLVATTPTALSGDVAPVSHSVLSEAAFEDAWQSAQTKLGHGQYTDALLTLSMLYSDEGVTPPQRSRLITVLDQLAGSVIYSPQHLLERPYVVAAGDTWDNIAMNYGVPAEFLLRVNQLSTNAAPPPGTQLKVVRGPFRGEVQLGNRELTLFLGRLYAGRFGVEIGRDLPETVTALEVTERSGSRLYRDPRTGQVIPAGAPENPYGKHWIGLRDAQGSEQAELGIHDIGSSLQADDARGCIAASERDVQDLQAILSVGSRIQILK